MPALTKIGECYSGLLASRRSRFHRVVLATPAAVNRLRSLPDQHEVIQSLKDPAIIHFNALTEAGIAVQPYHGWRYNITLGLRLAGSAKEKDIFNRGVDSLADLEPGLHRRIALRMMGVEIDTATEELSPRIFSCLFAKVEEQFQVPDFKDIAAVSIAQIPFDFAESRPDGNHWHLSEAQLVIYPKMSYLKIPKAE